MKKPTITIIIILLFCSYLCVFIDFCLKDKPRLTLIIPNHNYNQLNTDSRGFLNSFVARDYIGLDNDSRLTGKGITVAVLDTGIYPNHSVFTDNETINWNERIIAFYDEDYKGLNPNPHDISYHGTWAASILGGNSSSYQGVAPGVDFVIMKIFYYDDNNKLISSVSKIEDAVDWIKKNKEKYNIDIISMSFGADTEDNLDEIKELNEIVEGLVEEGLLVVAAAGNYGDSSTDDDSSITAPASAKSVLAVGGVDFDGDMYSNSGKGPTYDNIIKPDVCAPAVNVLGAEPEQDYSFHTGTSASTPFVSGLAALMLEKEDDLTALELKSIISLTSLRTIDPQTIKDNIQGWGIIQGYAALDALGEPVIVSQDTEIKFSLDEDTGVYCQPIRLILGHYFFELTQLDDAEAEIYLFDSEPDEDGNPILLSHSISLPPLLDPTNRIGAYSEKIHDYYLVVKLIHESGKGRFSITLSIEYRLGFIIILAAINLLSTSYVLKKVLNFKKRN